MYTDCNHCDILYISNYHQETITRDVMIIIQERHLQRLLLLPPATGHINTTAHDITALMHQYHCYCFVYSSTES